MKHFFEKYPPELDEYSAVKMIHKQLECAENELKEDENSNEYLKYLAKAYEMIYHFFDEKGIDPENIA